MREEFKSAVVSLVQVGVMAAFATTVAACIDETQEVAESAAGLGSAGTGGTGSIGFADDFETPGTWSFWSSSSSGNGYVSPRSADALSPSHLGDEYDRRGAAPSYQFLSRTFTLKTNVGPCSATVQIKPLTSVTGELQILDPANKTLLAEAPFTFGAASAWTPVSAGAVVAPSTNAIAIRVVLMHDSSWQELLVDDLVGRCLVSP